MKTKKRVDNCPRVCYYNRAVADVAHLVERHLAKVEVASSSLVIRSIKRHLFLAGVFLFVLRQPLARSALWNPHTRGRQSRSCAIPGLWAICMPCGVRRPKPLDGISAGSFKNVNAGLAFPPHRKGTAYAVPYFVCLHLDRLLLWGQFGEMGPGGLSGLRSP